MSSRRTESLIIFVVIFTVAGAFWTQSGALSFPNGVFPKSIVILVGGLAVINFAATLIKKHVKDTEVLENRRHRLISLFKHPLFWGSLSIALYFLCINVLGFYISTGLYLFVMYGIRSSRTGRFSVLQMVLSAVSAAAVSVLLYLIFTVALGVQTPLGLT